MGLKLIVGHRNYSSWSLRAWLYLKESGLEFEEVFVELHVGAWREALARYTPAGRVPVLLDDDITVWDSMAIMSYLLENYPNAVGWPKDQPARAHAQSIAAEMHAGFLDVRTSLPMNIRIRREAPVSDACLAQIRRIQSIWSDCRKRYGHRGDWLFGELTIADVMYVPVVLRFSSYGIETSGRASEFVQATLGLDSVQEWIRDAEYEALSLDFVDELREGDMRPG